MYCEQCGAKVQEGNKYCQSCGEPVRAAHKSSASQQPAVGIDSYQAPTSAVGNLFSGPIPSIAVVASSAFCGLLVFLSTFMSWISSSAVLGFQMSWSGMNLMTKANQMGQNTNFAFGLEDGAFWFSGFWSIIIGLAIIGCAVLLFKGKKIGGALLIVLGSSGFIISMVNLVMIYWKMNSNIPADEVYTLSAGAGLWVFLLFSIGAAVAGYLSYTYCD